MTYQIFSLKCYLNIHTFVYGHPSKSIKNRYVELPFRVTRVTSVIRLVTSLVLFECGHGERRRGRRAIAQREFCHMHLLRPRARAATPRRVSQVLILDEAHAARRIFGERAAPGTLAR
eukprot:884997-Pleurochrysis_carterae.AAC.3